MVAQPITGVWLVLHAGYPLTEDWILLSIALYLFIGAFWLPVVWMQVRMRDLAAEAVRQVARSRLPITDSSGYGLRAAFPRSLPYSSSSG